MRGGFYLRGRMLGTNQCSRGKFNPIDLVALRGQARHHVFIVLLWRGNIGLLTSSVSMVDVRGVLSSRYTDGPPHIAGGSSAHQPPLSGRIPTKSNLLEVFRAWQCVKDSR